ncbi:MAG: hypothetical protein AAF226_01800 [Verrucomicrobiota bacterium]
MKGRRKWFWIGVWLLVVGAIAVAAVYSRNCLQHQKLRRMMSEMGGHAYSFVPDWYYPLRSSNDWVARTIESGPFNPLRVQGITLVSGSHPLPDELRMIHQMPEVRVITFKTDQATDSRMTDLIAHNPYVEILWVGGESMSVEGLVNLAKTLPKLKMLHLEKEAYNSESKQKVSSALPGVYVNWFGSFDSF